jgi:signal transduction histidine kinase
MSRFRLFRPVSHLSAFRGLRVQLLLWIALPVAVSLLGISMVEIRGHEQAMTEMVQQQTDLVAHSLGVLIDAHIDQSHGRLLQLAGEYVGEGNHLIAPTDAFSAGIVVFYGGTSDAEQLAWAGNPAVTALAHEVRGAQTPGLATVYDDASQQWLLVQAVAVTSSSVPAPVVLMGAEPVDQLITSHFVASLDPTLIDGMRLTTAQGDLLYLQRSDTNASTEPPSTDPAHADHGLARWVTGQTTVLPPGWQVTIYKDWRELVPPVLTFGNVALVIMGIAVILSLLSAYFGLRNIVWPLQRLDHAVGQVGWGDFAAIQQSVGGVAEIEELRLALARMAEQIRQYQQELQSYIGAMTLGQEEERRRLARELHDATVQDLIALNQQLERALRELDRDSARAAVRLQELRPQVTSIIDGLRRQIHALRPLYLEDLGFIPALEMLVREAGQRYPLSTNFTVTSHLDVQPSLPIQISAFRIAQEALQNVLKHAQATRVDVSLHLASDDLTLRITDDGRGFTVPERPYHLAQAGHFGVLGMKERAQLHTGTLHIESKVGQGTTVVVRLPLFDMSVTLTTPTLPPPA